MRGTIPLFVTVFFVLVSLSFVNGKTKYTPKIADPLLETWRWTNYAELNGKGTRCIVEDKNQTIWFGINKGVLNYDGSVWTAYNASTGFTDDPVNSMYVSEDGLIYAASNNQLYILKNNNWTSLLNNINIEFEIFSIKNVSGIGLLCTTDKGIFWIIDDKITFYTSPTEKAFFKSSKIPVYDVDRSLTISDQFIVNNIFIDAKNTIWLAVGYTNGLSGKIVKARVADDNGLEFTLFYSEPKDAIYNNGATILEASDGKIYLSSNQHDQALLIFDGQKRTRFELGKMFGEDEICNTILQAKDKSIWVGGFGEIYIYKNGKWQIYPSTSIPIPSSTRILIYETSDGKMWIAGKQNEVFLFDNSFNNWTTYKELNFESETKEGHKWFITIDGRAVENNGDSWVSYGTEDGLIDTPVRIFVTKANEIWTAGSHNGVAATAYFENGKWHKQLHPTLSWNIDFRSILEDSNGDLWFGANMDINVKNGQKGGSLYLKNPTKNKTEFVHYLSQQTEPGSYGLGQDANGKLWMAGVNTATFENDRWEMISTTSSWWNKKKKSIETPKNLQKYSDFLCNDAFGNLWIGSRNYGIFYFNGHEWINHTIEDGLQSNSIIYIYAESEKSIWVATDKGISKFDGQSWTNQIFQSKIKILKEGGSIRPSSGGVIWINKSTREWNRRALTGKKNFDGEIFYAIFSKKDDHAPKPEITFFEKQVYQPGNATIHWTGVDPWNKTPAEKLQYSYRIDTGKWSPFSYKTSNIFLSLDYGDHTFEVRARDLDYNIATQTAKASFNVAPPFYLQPAFYIPLIILTLISIFLEAGVIIRGKKLKQAKRETDNILYNVQEGLALLNNKYEIGTQYSAILEDIFNETSLAGKNIIDIIRGKVKSDVLNNTPEFLELLFSDNLDPLLMESLNPLEETEFKFENGKTKYLTFKFTRVDDKDRKEIFVSVKDLTEQILLEQKLAIAEKEAKKQMDLMLSILRVEPSALKEFIKSSQEELTVVQKTIESLKENDDNNEELEKIGRSIHLVKGNASLLSLSFFADRAHVFEDKISGFLKKKKLSGKDIKTLSVYLNDLDDDLHSLVDLLNKIGEILDQMRVSGGKDSLRNSIINSFKNLIERFSREQNKEIELVYKNFKLSDIPKHNQILAKEIIVQLVRNSIAHGIESTEERVTLKKNPVAKIEIKTLNNDKYFGFTVRDDGRGIQLDKLREKAIASQKWTNDEIGKWTNKELLNLIFKSGITTSDQVNQISGRGVGMDLVNEKIAKYNGTININFENMKFCEFEVLIPKN